MPNDCTPLSNLSAARYEIGDYVGCIAEVEKTFAALSVPSNSPPTPISEKLKHWKKKAGAHIGIVPRLEQMQKRLKILENVPRYRPSVQAFSYTILTNTDTNNKVY